MLIGLLKQRIKFPISTSFRFLINDVAYFLLISYVFQEPSKFNHFKMSILSIDFMVRKLAPIHGFVEDGCQLFMLEKFFKVNLQFKTKYFASLQFLSADVGLILIVNLQHDFLRLMRVWLSC